jgi:hypothetical protein
MSNLIIWIHSGGGGREFHETLKRGDARYKSLGTSALRELYQALQPLPFAVSSENE